jgi:low temperature requirement protein LtrA
MYDGYIWLTGNVSMRAARNRIGIFAGMAGFLVMAIAIPTAFTATSAAVAFGVAYLVVILIHALMFSTAPNSSAQAILRIAPFNLAGALLVLTAAMAPEQWRWLFWLAAVLVFVSSSWFGRLGGWEVSAAHFVERHGLVVLVALGESVVAIGAGATSRPIDAGHLATAVLALAISAALWWVYFDRDDEEAALVLAATEGDRRSHLGLSIAYVHAVMIAGIILSAAGVGVILADPTKVSPTAAAWNLAAGIGIYLAGEAAFRYRLGLGPAYKRLVFAGLLLVTIPVGLTFSGVAQLACALGLLALLLVGERIGHHTRAG